MISQIGKYRVDSELGRGGFGQVYKAWDPDTHQPVAIKVLLAEGDPELLKRFQLEVVTTASLHHKNIVTIYISGEEGGTPYLVMELLEGKTIGQVIKNKIPLTLTEKVRIIKEVSEGLAFAHSKGVVHRDVKPANIMLLPDGSVKIMDFGIALASNRKTMSVTMDGFVVGTVPYMAPEQFTSEAKASEQTDIFSFGVVCYELLTGRHPFEAYMRDLGALRVAILTHDPQAISQLVPDCPEALELLVHRTLAKEREFRYQTFEDLRLDSATVLSDLQHDQAAAILREVPRLVAGGDLQGARAKVREAQALEPGNRDAQQWLRNIDQKLNERFNREKVAARLTEADEQLADRRFAEAVQNLETAVKLDTTNVVLQQKLADAKARLDASLKANRLVEEGRARQQKGEISEAADCLNRALEIDPQHTEALRIVPRLRELATRRQRDQIRQQAMRMASDHLAAKRHDQAIAVLDQLEKEQPGGADAADLRRRIEQERGEDERRVRAARFSMALTKTRDTMQKGQLDRARTMLDHLSANFAAEPGASEVLPLLWDRLKSMERSRDITAYRERADDLLKQKAFGEAAGLLTQAISKYPDDPGLSQQWNTAEALFQSQQHSGSAAAVAKRANSLRAAGDLRGAMAEVAEGRRRLGEDATLVELARQMENEERKRYSAGLRDLVDAVRELMASGRNAEAVLRMGNAKEYAGEAEVLALLDSARMAAGAEDEKRVVGEAFRTAAGFRNQGDFQRAIGALESVLAKYPRNPSLAQGLERLRDEAGRDRRSSAIQQHRSAILREMEAGAWKNAEAAVRRARSEFPNESAFDDLADRVESGLREQGLHEAASRVKSAPAASASAAGAQLEATSPVFSRDPRWKTLEEEVTRRRAYEEGLAEAERQRREGRLTAAEEVLTGLVASAPDGRATQAIQTVQAQRGELASAVAGRVRAALQRYDLRQANAELAAGRTGYPNEGFWASLQAEIDAWEAGMRAQAAIAESVQDFLRRDDLRQASAKLAEGRAKYQNEALWGRLQAEIEARRADPRREIDARQSSLSRQDQVAAIVESVRERTRRGDLVRAAADLLAAQTKFPEERIWATLQAEIDGRHEQLGRKQQISAIAENVRSCLQRDDFRQAAAELGAARTKYPDEAIWTTLKAEIDAHQSAVSRQSHVSAIAERVSERLKRDAFRQASAELNAARAKYPEEKVWDSLQAEIDTRQLIQNKVAAAASMVRELLKMDDVKLATAELSAARAKYPNEPMWSTLQQEIEARQALLNRRAQVGVVAESVRIRLERDDVKQAAAELNAAREKFPEEGLWNTLRGEIDVRQEVLNRRAEVAKVAETVRGRLNRDEIKQAAAELIAAKAKYPTEVFWGTLQSEIDSRQAMAAAADSIRGRVSRNELKEAAQELASARTKYPNESIWSSLQREIEARQARWAEVAAAAATIRGQLGRDEVQPAAAALAAARTKYPGEDVWAALQNEMEERQALLERQAQIAAAVNGVRERVSRDEVKQAAAELAAAKEKYPREGLWADLQKEIDKRQAYLQERAVIDNAAARVRARLARDEVEQALADLAAARTKNPGQGVWDTLKAEIETRKALIARQALVSATVLMVRERLKRDDVKLAAAELAPARLKYPDEPTWATLQAEIDTKAGALRQKAAVADAVRDCLKRDDIAQAQGKLDDGRAKYPNEPVWSDLQAEIGARQELLDKRAAVSASVRGCLDRGDIRRATEELAAGRASYPEDALWAALQAEIDARESLLRRKAAIADAIRDSLKRGDIAQATARLAEARSRMGDDPLWSAVQAEIAARQALLARQAEVEAIGEKVRNCLLRDEVAKAALEMVSARMRYPDEKLWAELQTEIDARQTLLSQQAEVSAIAESIRRRLNQNDLLQAAAELVVARAKFPGKQLWDMLQVEIETRQASMPGAGSPAAGSADLWARATRQTQVDVRQAKTARQAEIDAIAEGVRACLRRDDLRQAAVELGAARIRYPEEGLWATLKSEMDLHETLRTQNAHVVAIAERVRERLKRGALRQAAAELRSGRVKYPKEPMWAVLQAEIDAAEPS